ncbi:acyl-CoA desaturase [Fopius arisanus]|uniref:Acyl-CoA desaturase n=1 Tax=Fopius arisanus TaxID=64838 RepID=A0A9R1T605_9HYME|nr:PREDICTED: acyl-CoA desaturase [Fopius arisanus]
MEKELSGKREAQWIYVLWYIHLYILGSYGIYKLADAAWTTFFFAVFIILMGALGITVGAHRHWAHQSFEAHWFIKVCFMISHTLVGVGPIYDWVLAHRIHHKFYGTDKDPYNHNKGFLYSHLVTNLMSNPDDYEQTAKQIDMRDIESDGIVWFQRKFYWPLFLIVGLLLPINAPAEYWGESIINSVFILGFLRLTVLMNISFLVNSAMHIWGLNLTDKFPPDDNLVFLINRSFWLNYHYLLPWDWKTDEFGGYDTGVSGFTIKCLNELGLINNLKTTSSQLIREALYKSATSKKTTCDVLDDLKKAVEYETARINLHYHH